MKDVIIPAAAIDLGYFAVKYAVGRETDQGTRSSLIRCESFRSFAPLAVTNYGDLGNSNHSLVKVTAREKSYFVGPDAWLRASSRSSRVALDSFSDSGEYEALFLGALHQIARHHIDKTGPTSTVRIVDLVMGLPLNTLRTQTPIVKSMVEGKHVVPAPRSGGGSLSIDVERCTVVAQPQGTLTMHMALEGTNQNTLVLDIGGGTFDWYLAQGTKVIVDRCGAHPMGMIAVVTAVADAINPNLRTDVLMLDRIDEALRSDKPTVKVTGVPVDLSQYDAIIDKVMGECLAPLFQGVSSLASLDQIIITGGGAKLVERAIVSRRPDLTPLIKINVDPVFSNVRGFFMLAEAIGKRSAKVAA